MIAEARRIAGVSDRFGDLLLGQTAADQDPLVRERYLDLRLGVHGLDANRLTFP